MNTFNAKVQKTVEENAIHIDAKLKQRYTFGKAIACEVQQFDR